MTRWGSFEAASRAEVVGNPPTSRNDSLGVVMGGVEGGGRRKAPNES